MIFKIAFRNIFRQKRRTLLTSLSMLGGFVLAAFFIGFSDGSYGNIVNLFTKNKTGHIQIHQKEYPDDPSIHKAIKNSGRVFDILKTVDGIEAFAPRVYTSGLVSMGSKSSGARVVGIDPVKENQTIGFDRNISEGKGLKPESSKEALIGVGLGKLLKAKVGDNIVIVSQGALGEIAYDIFTIAGILDTGDDAADKTSFYIHIDEADKLFSLNGRIHEIAINTKGIERVEGVREIIRNKLGNRELKVSTWKEFAKSFYNAMKADESGMWVLLMIIMVIVGIGVLNTVLMSVLERTREYGVLKAVGTRPKQIFNLVLTEVGIISVVSIVAGACIGFVINSFFANYGIPMPEPVSYGGFVIDTMKGVVNLRSFVIPAVTIFLVTMFVGFFPALRAAKTEAAKSMRTF